MNIVLSFLVCEKSFSMPQTAKVENILSIQYKKPIKKASVQTDAFLIRREWDSNPRWKFSSHTDVPGLHLKPLGHLSNHSVKIFLFLTAIIYEAYNFIKP